MSRLDNVINEVRNARTGAGKAWIFDDSGNVSPNVIVGDVIPLLEDLKDYEIDATDEEIESILEGDNTRGDNTYNWGANISNDLNINYAEGVEIGGEYYDDVLIIMVHLRGDIRGGYSDYFVVEGPAEVLYDCPSMYQSIDINSRYTADVNLFSEGYTVYDTETGDDVGEFYEMERKDLIRELDDLEDD